MKKFTTTWAAIACMLALVLSALAPSEALATTKGGYSIPNSLTVTVGKTATITVKEQRGRRCKVSFTYPTSLASGSQKKGSYYGQKAQLTLKGKKAGAGTVKAKVTSYKKSGKKWKAAGSYTLTCKLTVKKAAAAKESSTTSSTDLDEYYAQPALWSLGNNPIPEPNFDPYKYNNITYTYVGTSYGYWNKNIRRGYVPQGSINNISSGTYYIKSMMNSNLALDIDNARSDNGARAQVWDFNRTAAQKFTIKCVAPYIYTISAVCGNGRVLTVEYNKVNEGAIIHQWTDQSSEGQYESQRWFIVRSGNSYQFVNVGSGLVLSIYNNINKAGTKVHQWGNWYDSAQKWTLTYA